MFVHARSRSKIYTQARHYGRYIIFKFRLNPIIFTAYRINNVLSSYTSKIVGTMRISLKLNHIRSVMELTIINIYFIVASYHYPTLSIFKSIDSRQYKSKNNLISCANRFLHVSVMANVCYQRLFTCVNTIITMVLPITITARRALHR